MSEETRQQRRARQRLQLRDGERASRDGLPPRVSREALVGAAQWIKARLTDKRSRHPISDAVAAAHAINDASQKADAQLSGAGAKGIACKKGCGYCCHSYVAVSAPEAILLAGAVRVSAGRGGASVAIVRQRAAAMQGLGPAERFGRKISCPLLVDGACSQYFVRPRMCRQVASFAVEPCIDEFEGRDGEMQAPRRFAEHAVNAEIALLAALTDCHLPTAMYALADALVVALDAPDAEERWRAGDDPFAGLPHAPPVAAAVQALASDVARDLG